LPCLKKAICGGEPQITHIERTPTVHVHQTRNGSLELDIANHSIDFSKLEFDAISQSGPVERLVGLDGKYTPAWALVKPPGVEVDVTYMTYVKYIKSFIKTSEDEPDRVVLGQWNDSLRKYTSGSKYFKQWKAQRLAEFTSDPDEQFLLSQQVDAQSQSGEMRQEGATTTTQSEVKQTTEFHTDIDQVIVELDTFTDTTRLQASVKNTELGDFLSRPLRIGSHNLTNGFYLDLSFNPWHDFLSNTTVGAKLEHYSLIRGTMHVKFLINGGPFYFGNIICGYKPKGAGFDFVQENLNVEDDYFQRATLLSQRQHLIINPTNSQGGELKLPFFHDKNYLDLIDATDILDMGEISMISLAPLDRAMGASNQRQINITVMAWMTDVELAGPTTRGILSQSGEVWKDEYGKGIISRPAKAIARWAGRLKAVPEIGPYATATQMAAAGVGSIAEYWGLSRPINVGPIDRYKHQMYGILANSAIDEAVEKLTYDPKQELTIDHNVAGAKLDDELSIKAITSKSSLLTYFTWSAVANENTLLGTINVTPCHCSPRDNGTTEYGIEWVQTPLAHATFPFKYWRGGLNYRFQINCSDFHRGRLLLVYDPRGFPDNDTSMPDTNTVFSRILDLEETKDFTLPIYWFQQKSWAKVPLSPTDLGIAKGNTDPSEQKDFSNGQLRIYVLNELASPDEDLTNSVRILTFISGAEDYEVAVPSDYMIKRAAFGGSFFHTTTSVNNAWSQSGTVKDAVSQSGILNNTKAAMASKPGHEGSKFLEPIGEMSKPNALALVYNGETFDSFRDMFKRYNLSGVFARKRDATYRDRTTRYRLNLPNFPMYNGRTTTNGMYQQDRSGGLNAVNYNITGRTLLNWITPAFAARRGGIRYKYMLGYHRNTTPFAMVVSRGQEDHLPTFGTAEIALDTASSNKHAAYASVQETGHNGSAFTSRQHPVVEVELPYYSDKKFEDASSIVTANQYPNHTHHVDIYDGNRKVHGDLEIFQYVATGEDFNLSWYVNAPSFFVQNYSLYP
jgi:hypothetical protein